MKKNTLTEAELKKIPKDALVVMYLSLAEQMEQLQVKIDALQENMNVLIQQRYGRKTEQSSQITGQLAINSLGEIVEILNEAEQLTEDGLPEEPSADKVIKANNKRKGKKTEDISKLEETTPTKHIIPETELNRIFPNGYKELPPVETVHVEYQPTRKTENPREFLKDYSGILLTDGYQVYLTLKKENPDKLTVAGCWVHYLRSIVIQEESMQAA